MLRGLLLLGCRLRRRVRGTYGDFAVPVKASILILVLAFAVGGPAAEDPLRIVVLGDSLSAGYGVPADAAFPVRLEHALRAKGLAVEVANAGVSGDTASGGLARLDWAVPPGTDAVILELGANDMLRGIDPDVTERALGEIVRRLDQRGIALLLAGMRAAPNLGADYARRFDAIYPKLAADTGVLLYPFFLDGVAAQAALNQGDGMHPSASGVDEIVRRILPKVEALVSLAGQNRGK